MHGIPMNLEDAIRLSKDLRIFGQTLRDSAKVLGSTVLVTRSIKRLAGGSKSSDLGSKLITAGMACVVFPEPLFSDLIGLMLIATGMLVRSGREPTIMEMLKETKRVMVNLRRAIIEM